MKKMNRNLIMYLLCGFALTLTGCGNNPTSSSEEILKENEVKSVTGIKYIKKDVEIVNHDNYVITNLKTADLYFKENSDIPYIGVKDLTNIFAFSFTNLDLKIDIKKDYSTFTYLNGEHSSYLEFDSKNNVVYTNNPAFFKYRSNSVNLDSHPVVEVSGQASVTGEQYGKITYNLGKYGYDIDVIENEEVILPLHIIDPIIFSHCVWHMFYNQDKIYFLDHYFIDDSNFLSTYNPELINKEISDELKADRFNQLVFLFDNFYGFRKEFSNDNGSMIDFINKNIPNIKDAITNGNLSQFYGALKKFINVSLDDPHTVLDYKSNYDPSLYLEDTLYIPLNSPNEFGERYTKIFEVADALYAQYTKDLPDNKNELYRVKNDMAVIKFDSFDLTRDELFDENGNLLEDAYLKDTFLYVRKALETIKNNEPNVKKVILDISQNLGGFIEIGHQILGLLTNEDLRIPTLNGSNWYGYYLSYKVDADLDGDFTDNDAYDQYEYYILTSECTFSTGLMTSTIAHDMGIATLIGQNVAGGMCSTADYRLIDGTTLTMSSNLMFPGMKKLEDNKYEMYNCDTGLEVENKIPYEKFYDLDFLSNYINNL